MAKVLRANDDLLREINRQLDMGVECVSEVDKWMLEIDVVQLASFSLAEKGEAILATCGGGSKTGRYQSNGADGRSNQ